MCSPCSRVQVLLQRFETAVMLPDLVSHMAAMSVLCIVDQFALRCIFDVIDLLSSWLMFCRFFKFWKPYRRPLMDVNHVGSPGSSGRG